MARQSRLVQIAYPTREGKSAEEFLDEVQGFCLSVGKEVLSLTNEVAELQDKFA